MDAVFLSARIRPWPGACMQCYRVHIRIVEYFRAGVCFGQLCTKQNRRKAVSGYTLYKCEVFNVAGTYIIYCHLKVVFIR